MTTPERHHREHATICLANLIMTTQMFMLMTFSIEHTVGDHPSNGEALLTSLAFFIGMALPGPVSSYLVDRYRRKTVCNLSIMALAAASLVCATHHSHSAHLPVTLVQGISYGLFQMSMGATLLNDLTLSNRRTTVDYFYTYLTLLGLPLGVALAQAITATGITLLPTLTVLALSAAAIFIVIPMRVPFRAPVYPPLLSLDRFFYPKSALLIVNLLPSAIVAGFFVGSGHTALQMLVMAGGIAAVKLAHRAVFSTTDVRVDYVCGAMLTIAALLLLNMRLSDTSLYLAYFMTGCGLGLLNSRIFLYFIKMSGHCQRGTLQQTYVLTLFLGIGLGIYITAHTALPCYFVGIGLLMLSLLIHLLLTYRWFISIHGRDFKFKET